MPSHTAEERTKRRAEEQRKRGKLGKPTRKKTPDLKPKKDIGKADTTKGILKAIESGIKDADADAKRKKK